MVATSRTIQSWKWSDLATSAERRGGRGGGRNRAELSGPKKNNGFETEGSAAGWWRRPGRFFLRASGFSDGGGGGRKNLPSGLAERARAWAAARGIVSAIINHEGFVTFREDNETRELCHRCIHIYIRVCACVRACVCIRGARGCGWRI